MPQTSIARNLGIVALASIGLLTTGANLQATEWYDDCYFRGVFGGYEGFECYNQDSNFCTFANGNCDPLCYYLYGSPYEGDSAGCFPQGLPWDGHVNLLCDCYPNP